MMPEIVEAQWSWDWLAPHDHPATRTPAWRGIRGLFDRLHASSLASPATVPVAGDDAGAAKRAPEEDLDLRVLGHHLPGGTGKDVVGRRCLDGGIQPRD